MVGGPNQHPGYAGRKRVLMYTNNTRAVVVKTFRVEGLELRLTEKGAVSVYKTADGREPKWSHSLTPGQVVIHAELGCPVFFSIVQDPAFVKTQENKELNKAKSYLEKQIAREEAKAQQRIQAAREQLARLEAQAKIA